MVELKLGDVVEYVYPQFSQGHGSIAVVVRLKPEQHYSPTRMVSQLLHDEDWPHRGA